MYRFTSTGNSSQTWKKPREREKGVDAPLMKLLGYKTLA